MMILGIDPGMAHLGVASLQLLPGMERVMSLGVISTERSDRKQKVLAADDNVRRCASLFCQLRPWFRDEPVVVACEAQSWPRNASSSVKIGMSWGVVVALAALHDTPILQVPPREIKRQLCGSGVASKAQVQDALSRRFGVAELKWPQPSSVVEHASDALAAAVCCLSDPTVMSVRRALFER